MPVLGETEDSEVHRAASSALLELPVRGDGQVRTRLGEHEAGVK